MRTREMYHELSMVELEGRLADAAAEHADLNGCNAQSSSDVLRDIVNDWCRIFSAPQSINL